MEESDLKEYLSSLRWQKSLLIEGSKSGSSRILFLLGCVEISIKTIEQLLNDFSNNIIDEN